MNHTPAPTTPTLSDVGITHQLNAEWTRLRQLHPGMQNTLREWGQAEPALAEITDLDDILTRINDGDAARKDSVMVALLRIAQTGQNLAGRVLVQAMLPKLVKMATRMRHTAAAGSTIEDHRQALIAEFWTVVLSYPTRRASNKVAARLALDTLHRATAEARRTIAEIPIEEDTLDSARFLQEQQATDPTPGPEPHGDADQLTHLLTWAVDNGTIHADDANLLLQVYQPNPNATRRQQTTTIADELGCTPSAVRKRCSRIKHKLTAAVENAQTVAV